METGMGPRRAPAGPGQESVWDYPRPPRLEAVSRTIRVLLDGEVLAETTRALRVLETSHPPVYYLPREDVRMDLLEETERRSSCEWKGEARYFTVRAGGRALRDAAWSYPRPAERFGPLAGHLAFYLDPLEGWVGEERARPQPGRFYGGWVTSEVVGPFKGDPGTGGW
jgi:uncharacterized protein (DUF427 family)